MENKLTELHNAIEEICKRGKWNLYQDDDGCYKLENGTLFIGVYDDNDTFVPTEKLRIQTSTVEGDDEKETFVETKEDALTQVIAYISEK